MDRNDLSPRTRGLIVLAASFILVVATIGGAAAHVDLDVDAARVANVVSSLDDERHQDPAPVISVVHDEDTAEDAGQPEAEDVEEPEAPEPPESDAEDEDIDAPEAEDVDAPEAEDVDEPEAPEPPESDADDEDEDDDDEDRDRDEDEDDERDDD